MTNFIPWGELPWLMNRLPNRTWAFIGCISHEQRCVAALTLLRGLPIVPHLVRIFDEDPLDEDQERASLDILSRAAVAAGVPAGNIEDVPLLATVDTVEDFVARSVSACSAVIVDITSLPKRWFFVITRLLKQNASLQDVIFTYALGARYADVLSSNPEIIRTIPTFSAIEHRSTCDIAFVGIGFHSHSVLELFDLERPKSVTMLFPFPPGPPGIARNWKFVEQLERSIRFDRDDEIESGAMGHVHLAGLDVPQNFHALKRVTDNGFRTSLLAPYGPKPVS